MHNLDDSFITEIINKNFENVTECSAYIYQIYSNQTSQSASKNSSNSSLKYKIIFDNGWFYKNNSEFFFRKTGKYLLQKGVEYVTVNPEEFIINYDNTQKLGFTSVSIQIQKYLFHDGWKWYVGDNYLGFKNRLRFYFSFNLQKNRKANTFIKELAELLDVKGIAYKIKIEQTLTDRNENAVLYFNKSQYYLVFIIVHSLCCEKGNKHLFRESNLLFVKKLSEFQGLAFAENPNDSDLSFGETMSNLVAEGILYKNVKTKEDLNKFFKKRGYNPESLYINPNTHFNYNFDIFDTKQSKVGLIQIEDEIKNTQHAVISKIAMILAKHAIIYKKGRSLRCDWLKAKINDYFDEVDYFVCDQEDKLEILEFLIGYICSFKILDDSGKLIFRRPNDSDLLIIEISKIAFQSIKKENLTNGNLDKYKEIKDVLYPKSAGSVNTPLIVFQQLMDEDTNEIKASLEAIEYNLKTRGIVSYLPDDEFNPNQSDFGYAYLGLVLLKRMEESKHQVLS